jgi:outer membrane protein
MKTCLFALLLAPPLIAQAIIPLTLPEAEALAVKNNPDVSTALLNAAAANQVTIEVRSAFFPTIYGSLTGVGALAGSSLSAGTLTNSNVYSRLASGVVAGQLISDFGRTSNLTASARLRAEGQQDRAKATRAAIILQVDQAYFSALRASSVLQVAQETVAARQTVADQVKALTNVNLKSGLDLSFANVNLSEAKLLLLNAQNDVKSSQAELSNALGYRDPQSFTLAVPNSPAPPPDDATALIRASLQSRPEIQAARADFNSAEKFVVAEKDLRNPTISAIGSAGVAPVHADQLRSRYAAAGVNVNIPIFNGHLFSARQSEAELRAQSAEQAMHSLENRIVRDVQVAFLNLTTSFQRVGLTDELLAQAALAMDLAQARYDLGLSSIVELTQAQLNKTSAQIANASARFDYDLQRAVLDYQTGVVR